MAFSQCRCGSYDIVVKYHICHSRQAPHDMQAHRGTGDDVSPVNCEGEGCYTKEAELLQVTPASTSKLDEHTAPYSLSMKTCRAPVTKPLRSILSRILRSPSARKLS